jgi:hypothetical protein
MTLGVISCWLMPPEEDEKSILTKEIGSWKGFGYALRESNAALFNKMLKEYLENEEYASASRTKGPQYSAVSLFMALIFQQQKMISGIIKKIRFRPKNLKNTIYLLWLGN